MTIQDLSKRLGTLEQRRAGPQSRPQQQVPFPVPIPIPIPGGGTTTDEKKEKPGIVIKQTVKQVVGKEEKRKRKRKIPSKITALRKEYNGTKKQVIRKLRDAKSALLKTRLSDAKSVAARKAVRKELSERLKKLLADIKPTKNYTNEGDLRQAIRVVRRLKW
jgi:hypothetical protein